MMICQWVEHDEPADGWRRVRCEVSGWVSKPTNSPLDKIFGPCPGCIERAQGGWRAPGNVLRSIIWHATRGKVNHGIACEMFRMKMNVWGWRGCWKNRQQVLKRIRSEAAKEGYRCDALSLVGFAILGVARWSVAYRSPIR